MSGRWAGLLLQAAAVPPSSGAPAAAFITPATGGALPTTNTPGHRRAEGSPACPLGLLRALCAPFCRGEGVVGRQPELAPGQSFFFQATTPLSTPLGEMHGHFEM